MKRISAVFIVGLFSLTLAGLSSPAGAATYDYIPTLDPSLDAVTNTSGLTVTWDNLGDATDALTLDVTGYTTTFTSQLDGGSVWSLTSTDTDVASDTILFDLSSYDTADANGIFLRAQSDVDGTPTEVFVLDQTAATLSVPISFAGISGTGGSIDIYEDPAQGTNRVRMQVPTLAADWDLTLPPDNGDAGEVLQTDGSGVTTWEAAGSGDITSVGDVLTGAAFTGTAGTVLTFNNASGDQTLTYSVGGDLDFNFSDDVNVRDTDPHVKWVPASGDSYEAYAYGSEFYFNNLTDSVNFWKVKTNNILRVGAGTEFVSGVDVSGPTAVYANLSVGNGSASAGVLSLKEDTDAGSNFASFQAPALSSNTAYILPSDDGDADQVLSTNGSGTLDWVTPSAGSGDITSVGDCTTGAAFDGGSCGGTLTFNRTLGDVTIGFDAGTDDFQLTDDLNIVQLEPHLLLDPTTAGHDSFELYAYGDEAYFNDTTDGVNIFKVKTDNTLMITPATSLGGTLTLQNGETIANTTNGAITLGGGGGTNNETLVLNFEAAANQVNFSSTSGVTLLQWAMAQQQNDDQSLIFGTGADGRIELDTAETNDTLKIGVDVGSSAQSGNLILVEDTDVSTNLGAAIVSNPTLRIQSADAATATDYISFYHDQTDPIIEFGNATAAETFRWDDASNNDFLLSDDLTLADTDPHLKLVPSGGGQDAFEVYAYGDEFYLTDTTDGVPIFKVTTGNDLHVQQELLLTKEPADGSSEGTLTVRPTMDDTAGSEQNAILSQPIVAPGGTSTESYIAINGIPLVNTAQDVTGATIVGVAAGPVLQNASSVGEIVALAAVNQLENSSHTTISTGLGISNPSLAVGASMDYNAGIRLEPMTGAGTGNFGICFDCDGTWSLSTVAAGIQFGIDAGAAALYRGADTNLYTTGDLDINDGSPHLRLTDTNADDFEWYADGSNLRLTNVTDSIEILGVDTSNNIFKARGLQHADFQRTWRAVDMEPLEAADSIPPISKWTGTNVDIETASYDSATDEGRKVTFVVPSYVQSGSTVTFTISWFSRTATTGGVVWDVRYQSTGAQGESWDQALTTLSFGAKSVAGTTNQMSVTSITETLANLGWAAGDVIDLMIYRDANHAGDSMTGDAELRTFTISIPQANP